MRPCIKCGGDMDEWTKHKVGDEWLSDDGLTLNMKLFSVPPQHLPPCFIHTFSCDCWDVRRVAELCEAAA